MTLHDPHDGEQRYESDGLDFLAPLDHVEDDGDSMELPAFPTASDPDDEPVPTGEAFGAPFPGTATEGDPGVGDHTNEIFDLASTASTSENQVPMTVVTNPPETVAVTAYPTGNVARIELSHKVTAMTEAELAEEIVVVADTATKKASALVYGSIVDALVEHGLPRANAQEFAATNMPFATPEQAKQAELALITRHAEQGG
ncbi:hypothetical protein [Mycolicibacterium smegmatis]|nr:hypothetical protein [Mycolicibacterium smegmatis]MCC3334862.1 hypothetical protein [Mycolicibacterium smegmatis]MCO4196297.1 hypothetical protein [Mycolicibacterium smegmatis]MCP2628346.1 hypothetical protein [Mycolicibacterium smegmatis]MDF1902452.1 hypothetical protein [Mycolicibacterium smegmatis]MDF1908829.1 hypothetical protein [Mycolicibacterium smegmatis]